ncbi:hypothetical protein A6J33_018150 [Pantoea sp. FDAARGOS_194]|uniref:hypothetical protein n=1 Tax=Pantoea TaxID=53335 RepID=UPI0006610CE7|nr:MULTISPECIES: hypothetical protein [Pantoea]PNK64568.1 hypothetical protein A6J33_018150 [Pantoea sp. FDAARGOS_194]
MGKPYTNRDMKRIQELAGQLTPQQIGNIIGRTGASVREFAARHHISLSMKYNKPGYHEAEQIVRMKAEGYSFAKIGAALGLSKTTCLSVYRRSI